MIVCKNCGYRNAGADSFCGSCGAFLEWTGERVEQPKPAPVEAEPEPEPAPKKGLLERVQSLLYMDVGDRDPIPRTGPGGSRPGGPPSFGGGPPGMGGPPGSGPGAKPLGFTPSSPPGGRPGGPPPPPPSGPPRGGPPPPPPPPGGPPKTLPPPPGGPPPGGRPPGGPPLGGPPAGGPPAGGPPAGGPPLGGPPRGGPPAGGPPFGGPPPGAAGSPPGATGTLAPPPGGARITEGPGAGALVAPLTATGQPVAPAPTSAGQGMSSMPVRPAGSGPDVVAPQEHGRARRTMPRSAPSRELQPGDLVCGECGEANLPTRRFCSRCGNELNDAEVVKAKWWRRLLPKRKPRAARAVEADSEVAKTGARRQHKKSIFPALRRTVAILLVVGGAAYAAVPGIRGVINTQAVSARQRVEKMVFGTYVPVRAVKATSTPVTKGHLADAAVDEHKNTYWSTPVAGARRLTLIFQQPVELRKVIITGGIVGNLRGSQRPHVVHFVYPSGKGQDIELKDVTDPQTFDLDSKGKISSVEIYVQSTYQNAESKQVTITEVELFTKEN